MTRRKNAENSQNNDDTGDNRVNARIRKQRRCEDKGVEKKRKLEHNVWKSQRADGSSSRKAGSSDTVNGGKSPDKTQNKTGVSSASTKTKRLTKRYVPEETKKVQKQSKQKVKKVKEAMPSTRSSPQNKDQKREEKVNLHSIHTNESEEEEEEEAACCLCHCGVDCNDRALFFAKDRKLELEEDEDYYFSLKDPYLDGEKFYDRNNALVYCDTCNRLYHQKCHFVPLLIVPRGEFHCLICTIQKQKQTKTAIQGKNKSSKRRDRKVSIKPISSQCTTIPPKFFDRKVTNKLFQSPPVQSSKTIDIKSLEKEWEVASGPAKARLWDLKFKQLRTFLKSQASNIRMANTTLATMTSTKRNRQHFLEGTTKTGTKSSQELAQTLCKLTGAKSKIREAFLSLESLRVRKESIPFPSLDPWCKENPEHANHVFPFGYTYCKDERRIVPRTRERKEEGEEQNESHLSELRTHSKKANDVFPNEITVSRSGIAMTSVVTKFPKESSGSKRIKTSHEKTHIDSDDSSGITLDDLQCAICMIGDATDENDVILCDGKDCHRAYHMHCVYPPVKKEDIEDEDNDWFCPICSYSAQLMGEIHDLCVDDENEDASSDSWEDVGDIFPGSQWEYETATKILKGKRNEDTQRLLEMFLGESIKKAKVQMPVGSDSEDENDYSLFDEESFQEKRRQEREDENKGNSDEIDSICSSQATLLDFDDIDYKVGKAELAALSEEECSESNSEGGSESENRIRKSRRLEKKEEVEESNPLEIGADFDEANIILGKRKRKRVNYRKLNDMMFGDLSDKQQVIIDGGDDFDATSDKPMKSESGDESDDESDNSR
eukprot:CAMPEP_0197185506 /NCGR_PEP_ID=MMETSP1423-20130617/12081_1 /TAXON_ID=476441 /ORGANISM="Pseudo-nitzschia heimii, Strain UNC1101" /LENGTH=831 /DNA_ID=CAMNT_0042636587 /DNA_START=50 /DNA_END=2545 /DNA_ORIENTATION=+